jgi:hypothetical protein
MMKISYFYEYYYLKGQLKVKLLISPFLTL